MIITPNLLLKTWDITTDGAVLFKDMFQDLAGTVDSNMTKLDALAQNLIIGTDDELGVPIPVDADTLDGYGIGEFLAKTTVPTTSTSTGLLGQFALDSSYLYVCISTNVWKRTELLTW